MKISRRSVIRNVALLGPASAVVNLSLLSSTMAGHAAVLAGPSPRRPPADGAGMGRVVFRIDGWDRHDETAIDRSITPSPDAAVGTLPDHEVWIGVNRSWRAAWR